MGFVIILLVAMGAWAFPPWEIGLGAGSPNPLTFSLGVRPGPLLIRAEGGGWVSDSRTGWGGGRIALGHEWVSHRWYGLESNLSAGYFKAQAVDSMHLALNESADGRVLYESNWEETTDLGAELGFRLFAFHARAGLPLFTLGNHRPPFYWRLGIIWIFGGAYGQ